MSTDIGAAALKNPKWQWYPGMLAIHQGTGSRWRCCRHPTGLCFRGESEGFWWDTKYKVIDSFVPDLNDFPTLGAALLHFKQVDDEASFGFLLNTYHPNIAPQGVNGDAEEASDLGKGAGDDVASGPGEGRCICY